FLELKERKAGGLHGEGYVRGIGLDLLPPIVGPHDDDGVRPRLDATARGTGRAVDERHALSVALLSGSPGRLPGPGPHQIRTRRFPPSGSSAEMSRFTGARSERGSGASGADTSEAAL